MEIVKKTDGNKATLEISGWLEYISSAGLRQVIVAYKKMMGKDGFKIINVSDEVFDIFRLTGFDQQIEIER